MLKRILSCTVLVLLTFFAQAQSKTKKLSKEEAAGKTQEQRIVHESNRKSKNGKKDLSTKKKVQIAQKQDRRARKTKTAKGKKRKN